MARKTAADLTRTKRKVKHGRAAQVAARINLQLKRDVVKMASDARFRIERVPTGSLTIDRLTNGGFARGRHIELFGDWMVGKSLLAYTTMVKAQERGEICAVLDPEHVFNAQWFTELGGDVDELLMPDFTNAQELGAVVRLMEQSSEEFPGVDIVLIDSVASMLTKEEQEYDLESEKDVRTASLARFMSLFLRQVTTANQNTLFIWTNQWRDKISQIPGLKSTPGGRALGFYASTRIEMMQGEKETDTIRVPVKGKEVERKSVKGRWINCRVVKEKTGGRPEQFGAFMLDFDTNRIDVAREIIDIGMRDGLVKRVNDHFHLTTPDGSTIKLHGIKRTLARLNADDELRGFLVAAIEESTAQLAEGGDG